jgi:hypothetical protein
MSANRLTLLFVLLLASGCASLRPTVSRVPSEAIAQGDQSMLGRAFGAQAREHPGQSGFQVVIPA